MKNNLIYNTPLNFLGYGVVGTQFLKQLYKISNICLFPIGNIDVREEEATSIIKETHYAHNAFFEFDKTPILKIFHQHSLFERPGNGKLYGFPIFELDTFTDLELASLNQCDELIVCSHWAKEVIKRYITGVKVSVIPLGVDRDIFKPQTNDNKTYTFFNIGKLSKNKGHDILASAFNKAFDQKDNVQLKLLCNNPFLNPQEKTYWTELFTRSKLANKIHFVSNLSAHQEVADFINSCDCGVFPARAEGWNLGLLESMACGKPVITTNYSGHTEYCTNDNAYLIDIDSNNLELANDGKWFKGQGSWACIDDIEEESLISHLRYCYDNTLRENLHGVSTAEHFTWHEAGKKLGTVLWN